MENSCKICGKGHRTGECQEFHKSQNGEKRSATSRLGGVLARLFGRGEPSVVTPEFLEHIDKEFEARKAQEKAQEKAHAERMKTLYKGVQAQTREEKDEQEMQAYIAASVPWLVAKKDQWGGDTRTQLETMGFKVEEAKFSLRGVLFYEVDTPPGWTKTTNNYWTEVKDEKGNVVLNQFYKFALHGERAHLQHKEAEQKFEDSNALPINFDKTFEIFSKMKESDPTNYRLTMSEISEMAFGGSVNGLRHEVYNDWKDADFLELLKKLGETEEVKKVEEAKKTGIFSKSR
ncbi:hypothetical protein HYV70_04860 [Candidatus Uhrbacteria bacterium]|nr:hypothetical protein [Candidatus Uhrbacteria bacterium]